MVKIAIAGGSSSRCLKLYFICPPYPDIPLDVAQEIIDVLVATGKHEIILLSRQVRYLPSLTLGCLTKLNRTRHRLLRAKASAG